MYGYRNTQVIYSTSQNPSIYAEHCFKAMISQGKKPV